MTADDTSSGVIRPMTADEVPKAGGQPRGFWKMTANDVRMTWSFGTSSVRMTRG
jgi:hypothetical protein